MLHAPMDELICIMSRHARETRLCTMSGGCAGCVVFHMDSLLAVFQLVNLIAWKLNSEAPVGRLPIKKVLCQHMLKMNKNLFNTKERIW